MYTRGDAEEHEWPVAPERILDTLDEVYYFLGPDGRLLQWNDRVPEVTGYSHEEVAEMTATDFFGPEDEQRVAETIATVVGERRQATVEADYRTKSGDRIPYEFSGTPVVEDGDLLGIVGVGREITDRRERERRLQTITENVPIVLFAIDADGTFLLSRGKGLESLGLEPGAVVGESVFEVYADAPALLDQVERALDGDRFRETVEIADRTFETWYQPVLDGGTVEQVVGVSQDVTDRVAYERQLEETKERLQFALEGTDTGIWEWNLETDAVVWNEMTERLFGLEPRSFEGTFEAFAERVHPDDLDRVESDLGRALENDEMYQSSFRVQRDDGEQIWTEARGQLTTDDDGTRRMVGIITDVTDQKEYERRLERSNERLEQFAYVASHDLQEPLRTVANFAGVLETDYADDLDETARDYIERVVTSAERMESMINGLLDYSRVTTRGGEFEPVDATAVVEQVVDDLAILLEEHDGTVEYDSLPTVRADPDQFRQVLQNLLTNALEHSGDDPVTVSVGAAETEDGYRFAVSDDGPGIDPDRQDDVFRIFDSSRRDHTRSQVKGVGLAVCDNIVRRHGGDIWVESEPGEGATFYFTIETSDAR